MAIGFGQQRALIRFFFGVNPKSFDEQATYWADFKYLVETKVIPMPNIPLEFK